MRDTELKIIEKLLEAECLVAYMAGSMKALYGLVEDEPTKNIIADIIVRLDKYNEPIGGK